jgi:L,D-transpeptidase ErfK/SrfK
MWGVLRGLAAMGLLLTAACGGIRQPSPSGKLDEPAFARKPLSSWMIPTPKPGATTDTVVGEVRTHTVRQGETLLDLARYYDLGFEELQQANPGVDPWVPPVGSEVVVPMRFVLPCCTYAGMIVNVPEMRMYWYHPGKRPGTTVVQTFPLGLGRNEYPTPTGVFHVKGKTVNPGWGVPESIRLEHLRERGDGRSFIKGGDPDNPLGKYRFELDRTLYRIHGTNFPWGIGRQVSHGCAQLYPEDIAHLFPQVPVGTRVEFVYQPVKIGRNRGDTFVEAHRDIYKKRGKPLDQARTALKKQGLPADDARVQQAVSTPDGVPRPVHEGGSRWPSWSEFWTKIF